MDKKCCEPTVKVASGWRLDYNPCRHYNTLYITLDTKELLYNGVVYNKFDIQDICFRNGMLYINVGNKLLSCKIPTATRTCAGLMSPLDKQQLDYVFQLLKDGIDSINISSNTSWGVGLIKNADKQIQPKVTPVTTFEELMRLQEGDEKLVSALLLKKLIECNDLNICGEITPTEYTVTLRITKDGETTTINEQRVTQGETYTYSYSTPRGYIITNYGGANYSNNTVSLANITEDKVITMVLGVIEYPIRIYNTSGAFTITNNPPTNYTVNSEDVIIEYTFDSDNFMDPRIECTELVRRENGYLVIPAGSIGNVSITFSAVRIGKVIVTPGTQVTQIPDGGYGDITFTTNVPATVSYSPTKVNNVWFSSCSSMETPSTEHTITIQNLTATNTQSIIESGTFVITASAEGYLDSDPTNVQSGNITLLANNGLAVNANPTTIPFMGTSTVTASVSGDLNANNTTWSVTNGGNYALLSTIGPSSQTIVENHNNDVTVGASIFGESGVEDRIVGTGTLQYGINTSIVKRTQSVTVVGTNNGVTSSVDITLNPQNVVVDSYEWLLDGESNLVLQHTTEPNVTVSLQDPTLSGSGRIKCKVTFSNGTVVQTESKTITYEGVVNQYTVTFNANGGTSTPNPITGPAGTVITLPAAITRASDSQYSYEFAGWNTNVNGTGTNYDAEASYTISGNVTLYAKWTSTPVAQPRAWLDSNNLRRTRGNNLQSISWNNKSVTPNETTSGEWVTLTKGTVTAYYDLNEASTTLHFENIQNPRVTYDGYSSYISVSEIQNNQATVSVVGGNKVEGQVCRIKVYDGETLVTTLELRVNRDATNQDVTASATYSQWTGDGDVYRGDITFSDGVKFRALTVTNPHTVVIVKASYEDKTAQQTTTYTVSPASPAQEYYWYVGKSVPTSIGGEGWTSLGTDITNVQYIQADTSNNPDYTFPKFYVVLPTSLNFKPYNADGSKDESALWTNSTWSVNNAYTLWSLNDNTSDINSRFKK